ncbi:hypothetical protein [Leptolyngbya sp. KIOST-1]|uniref:hypothetical protein n=1 Tax=Leptolyngbya sp. KIOST-1 TaxID=1229172 RepID=UPI000A4FFE61|nr:hypothetical protein [Leptolyngbya sp. KIOST-1]
MSLKRWLYAIALPQFLPLDEANVLSAMAIAIRSIVYAADPAPPVGLGKRRLPLRESPAFNRGNLI